MKPDLVRSAFSNDPEVMAAFERREQKQMLKAILKEQIMSRDAQDTKQDTEQVNVKFLKGEKGDEPSDERLAQLIEGIMPSVTKGEPGTNGIDGKDAHTPTKAELLALIEPLIPEPIRGDRGYEGLPGQDAHTPTDEELRALIVDLIPKPTPGRDGKDAKIPTIDEIYETFIKRMRKEKALDISQIRNADSFIFNGTKYKIHELMHGGGSSSSSQTVATADISSQFNGSATTFTIPAYSSILLFTITGYPPEGALRPTTDFTTPTATTVTISTPAPVSGTTGIIIYIAA